MTVQMTTPRPASQSGIDAERVAKLHYLSETDLFQDLTADDLTEVERSTSMSTCKRGRVFFTPGETGEVLFILKSGRVNVYRITAEGRKLVTATVGPGTVFGEMSFIGQGMSDSFAEAVEDSTLCVLSRSDLMRLLTEYPPVSVRLMQRLAQRLDEAEERLADVAYRPVAARIASTLLRLSSDEAALVRLSHQDIAEMVGTYRETATRILNEMQAQGSIELGRLQINILDRDALATHAEESE